MKRPIGVIAATALATMTVAAVAGGSAAQADATLPAGPQGLAARTLPDSAVPFATANRAMGAVAGSQQLTIQVWMKPRAAAAENYATAVSTPGSPLYQHFLSPAAYTTRFGATSAEAASVESWLTSSGFTGVAADAARDYVQATAPVSTINSAFKVQLKYYRASSSVNAGAYALRANDRAVTLPSAVAGGVLGVTGLDNAAPKMTYVRPGDPAATSQAPAGKPIAFPCSSYYAQHYARRLPKIYGTINIPTAICGYSANQLRRAYGYNRHNVGKGVTVALVEVGLTPDMFLTLQDYAKRNGIQAPSASRYAELSLGKGSACGDFFNIEEQLDVESSYAMAPMANQLVVGGDSCNNGFFGLQALFDADTAILNGVGGHPLAQIASNSWEGFDESEPVNILNIEHAYLVRAAVEGVSMLFSAGDGSGVLTPSSDPYATAVGGTTLGIGNKVARLFETGWSNGFSIDVKNKWIFQGEAGASGGGPSLLWAQPSYQRGVVPASLAKAPGNRGGLIRAVPDISADADSFTGMAVGLLSFNSKGVPNGFSEIPVGGTSLASPLVAGMVADAEQYQHHSFGFLNPALYKLAGTNAINGTLPITSKTPARYHGVACDVAMCGALSVTTFDDQSFSMFGYTGQVTRKGYDTMTGIGTPAGQNFVYALRKLG
jgi:subtilase family serine protease